jgi:hypothetical protein
MPRALPFAALILCGALLRADGLADLKAALKGLPAPAQVRMKVEEDSLEREEGKDRTEHRTVLLEDGPDGFRILEDSRPPSAPAAKKTGKSPGMSTKGASVFKDMLHPAEDLLEQLAKARLVEEKPEAHEGRPARRLKLAMDLDLDAEARATLKQADHTATVWIGADGLPLAMNHHIEIRARVLLFASVWTKVDIQRRFQRAQNRLLLLEEQAEVQGSALGKTFGGHDTRRCSVVP